MPGGKAFLLDTKTSSYHIKSIVGVHQSKTGSGAFKLLVLREGTPKRFDFEAESGKAAGTPNLQVVQSSL